VRPGRAPPAGVTRGAHPPWAYPAALGAVLGSAVATMPEPPALGHALLVLIAALLPLAGRALEPACPRPLRFVVLLVLAFVVVAGRGLQWSRVPDPWAARLGEAVTLRGEVSDGRLHVARQGSLLLRGVAVTPGRVEVRGELLALSPRRNPGGFDEAEFWRRRGVRAALRVDTIVSQAPPQGLPALRQALAAGVTAGLSPRAAALQQAVTLGLRYDLGELRGIFATAGLAHLLALSGLHVGVLAGTVAWLARPLGPRGGGLVVLAVVSGYVAMVGPGPSVVRAATMVAAVVVARALAVASPPLPAALALAAVVCLVARPAWVGDLGFQLSFLSLAGIAGLAAPALRWARGRPPPGSRAWQRRRWRLLRLLVAGLVTSAAAQAAGASLVAGSFGSLPLAAPLVNVVAVPLASLLVPLGALAGLAGLVHPSLAEAVNAFAGPLAEGLLAVATAAARAPTLAWGEVGPEGHVLAGCALLASGLALHRRLRWRSALAVVTCAACVSWLLPDRHGVPELVVLDVGQGDAIVVRLGGGAAVLIDGGGVSFGGVDAGSRHVVPALRALGIWRLALVVATHADLDHMGGLPAVLEAFPVGALLVGHAEPERPAWQALERVARRRGVPVRAVRRGEAIELGDVRLEVLHPAADAIGEGNADSVALLVRYRGAPWALLLGDVPAAVEADLPVPPTPILLAAHHGSATSTSAALVGAASPRLALVSVGHNRYGHPSAAVRDRLAQAGVPVVSTRDHGALRVRPAQTCARVEMSRPGAGVPGTC
jgi:competence protein ComEC